MVGENKNLGMEKREFNTETGNRRKGGEGRENRWQNKGRMTTKIMEGNSGKTEEDEGKG